MNGPAAAEKAIWTILTEDADFITALGAEKVYPASAPSGTVHPYVIMQMRSTQKVSALNTSGWLQAGYLYNVKVVTRESNSFSVADRLNHLMDAALDMATATVTIEGQSYEVNIGKAEDDIRFIAGSGDQRENHVGGVYYVRVSPTD
jgi:hypothetical protein